MTNDEGRRDSSARGASEEPRSYFRSPSLALFCCHPVFATAAFSLPPSSFVIRHSSFVISKQRTSWVLAFYLANAREFLFNGRAMNTDPLLPAPPLSLALTKEDRTWAMVIHLSAFAGHVFPLAHIIAPLVIWQVKKDTSAFLNDQGKEAVNAQISVTLYAVAAGILCFILIGLPLLAALYVANFVLVIVAAIAAHDGKAYRYPYILRLIQ